MYYLRKLLSKDIILISEILHFKDFLDLEKGDSIKNMSKIKFKRELQGVKIPHRKHDCNNCCNESKVCNRMFRYKPEMNCIQCEIVKSCESCLTRITRISEYSTKINLLKRQSSDLEYNMLPYNMEDQDNTVTQSKNNLNVKKCSKCKIEINSVNHVKNRTVCRFCYNQDMRLRREKGPKIKLCSKCFIEINSENYVKNRTVCKSCRVLDVISKRK